MSQVILISFCLQVLLGVALLLLWRIDRHHAHVRLWGWSALLLGVGLALGIGLAPLSSAGWQFDLQAGVASAALMVSIFYQMQGTAAYGGLAWNRRGWAVLLLVLMVVLAIVARIDLRYAVALGAAALASGNWLCAYWVRRGQVPGERMVALCFVAAGLVNASGPLLHPLSRSPITHALGLIVQTILSLGLILLSAARAHREAARQSERFSRLALHDELTDLPNRNFAVERLHEWTQPGAPAFALVSADLDRFQLVNESLGHAAGDALLRAVAARLKAALPPEMILARLGEDQFVMLIPGVAERPAAQQFVERLLAVMAPPFELGSAQLYVHVSIGAALFPHDAQDGAKLLRDADSALHRAKQRAGAAYAFFNPALNQVALHQLAAEQGLGRAIAEGEFLLEYQPKYLAHSRTLCGFEALVRWQRPGVGRVSPADFIPAAERTGQIRELGDLILRIACDQLRDWRQEFARVLPVAVNVSPLQFEDADLVDRILRYLDERELPHAALQIEITESAAIGRMDRVLPQLARLREAGIKCALDDFGTGQSSLTMLGRLPIDAMKLDRSMISPLPEPVASALVQAACVMGESLKLDIVAEGVETEVQAQSAEVLGCTQLQGFYLSRPLAAPLASALLETMFKR